MLNINIHRASLPKDTLKQVFSNITLIFFIKMGFQRHKLLYSLKSCFRTSTFPMSVALGNWSQEKEGAYSSVKVIPKKVVKRACEDQFPDFNQVSLLLLTWIFHLFPQSIINRSVKITTDIKSQKIHGFTPFTEIVGDFFLMQEKGEIVILYIKST